MTTTNQPPPTMEGSEGPFTKREAVDEPGIIGARWWQESLASDVPRRQALVGLLALGGVLGAMATLGTCAAVIAKSSSPPDGGQSDVRFEPRGALEMQKEYGWDFGAAGEPLVFDGKATQSFDRASLDRLADDLAPGDARFSPYFVPTLFQSPAALPKATASAEERTSPFVPLKDALVPISTPAMTRAFKQGAALASLLDKDACARDVAVIVDLPGPEAVAFAAGASGVLDPVFLFDNWPHPRGVVPAHLTLAAAAYYQPMFAKAKASRPKGARPLFVLDRARLAPYTDDATQFDNRHTARLPSASGLASLGTKSVVYVAPNAVDPQELDDLTDDFLTYASEKLTLKQHGSSSSNDEPDAELRPYSPKPRASAFSSGAPASTTKTRARPTGFGTVAVAVAARTGLILGAKMARSGSWNRTNYSSSGS